MLTVQPQRVTRWTHKCSRFSLGPQAAGLLAVLILGSAGCAGSTADDPQSASDDSAAPAAEQANSDDAASETGPSDPEAGDANTGQPGDTGGAGTVLSSTVDVGGGSITVVEALPVSDAAEGTGVTVLFLHGAAYTSQTWVDNDILAATADAGHRAIAVDLPGSGSSDRVDVVEEAFLTELFPALDLDPAATVIVSPSMSGIFSLPALRDPFFIDLAGYVPVAPSGAGSFAGDGPPVDTPALLVWGDGDGNDPDAAAARLAEGFTNAEVLILADAGHAAYQQQPEAFTASLLAFVDSLD